MLAVMNNKFNAFLKDNGNIIEEVYAFLNECRAEGDEEE